MNKYLTKIAGNLASTTRWAAKQIPPDVQATTFDRLSRVGSSFGGKRKILKTVASVDQPYKAIRALDALSHTVH